MFVGCRCRSSGRIGRAVTSRLASMKTSGSTSSSGSTSIRRSEHTNTIATGKHFHQVNDALFRGDHLVFYFRFLAPIILLGYFRDILRLGQVGKYLKKLPQNTLLLQNLPCCGRIGACMFCPFFLPIDRCTTLKDPKPFCLIQFSN